MRKDELKTKAVEMIDAAWDYAKAEGSNETSEVYEKKLAEKQKEVEAAYKKGKEEGFKEGHSAALENAGLTNPTEGERGAD